GVEAVRRLDAASDDCCAFIDTLLDVAPDPFALGFGDDRPQARILVEWVADLERFCRALGDGDGFILARAGDEHARVRGARLARVQVAGEYAAWDYRRK